MLGKFNKLKEKVRLLKSEIQVLSIAYSDPRTPWTAKFLIGITVGYLLSPIDLIPDFIPILGILDDLILVPLLITASIKLIPEIVMLEARAEAIKNPKRMKKNNWFVAIFILMLWLLLLYNLYSHFKGETSYF
jgi:uncharacterized membrane protein YkvA (DUF1232 family)